MKTISYIKPFSTVTDTKWRSVVQNKAQNKTHNTCIYIRYIICYAIYIIRQRTWIRDVCLYMAYYIGIRHVYMTQHIPK